MTTKFNKRTGKRQPSKQHNIHDDDDYDGSSEGGRIRPSSNDDAVVIDVILFGDSDIAFWPSRLYPSSSSSITTSGKIRVTQTVGIPGATLPGILYELPKVLDKIFPSVDGNDDSSKRDDVNNGTTSTNTTTARSIRTEQHSSSNVVFLVVCAGENDIGNGVELQQSIDALNELLSKTAVGPKNNKDLSPPLPSKTSSSPSSSLVNMIFLGPKFEPWMDDTTDSLYCKKKYATMSRAMKRCCEEFADSDASEVYYIDCLTMFCGNSAHQPGAILAGRATPERQYFASDGLHLNDNGYQIWKTTVEGVISDYLKKATTTTTTKQT